MLQQITKMLSARGRVQAAAIEDAPLKEPEESAAPPREDGPPLMVLVPDGAGPTSFRPNTFFDIESAEAFIRSCLERRVGRGMVAFWALPKRPKASQGGEAETKGEVVVLIPDLNPTRKGLIYLFTFLDAESAGELVDLESKYGFDLQEAQVYWAAEVNIGRDNNGFVELTPRTPPRIDQGNDQPESVLEEASSMPEVQSKGETAAPEPLWVQAPEAKQQPMESLAEVPDEPALEEEWEEWEQDELEAEDNLVSWLSEPALVEPPASTPTRDEQQIEDSDALAQTNGQGQPRIEPALYDFLIGKEHPGETVTEDETDEVQPVEAVTEVDLVDQQLEEREPTDQEELEAEDNLVSWLSEPALEVEPLAWPPAADEQEIENSDALAQTNGQGQSRIEPGLYDFLVRKELPGETVTEDEPDEVQAVQAVTEVGLDQRYGKTAPTDEEEMDPDYDIVEEVRKVLRVKRWEKKGEEPFSGFDSPPGKF